MRLPDEFGPLLATWVVQVRAPDLAAGAAAGVAAAVILAWAWSRVGARLSARLFRQVTTVFLVLFVARLTLAGFHALAEANVLRRSEAFRALTEPLSPHGAFGPLLPYMLLAVPLLWLGLALFFGNAKASDGRVADVGR